MNPRSSVTSSGWLCSAARRPAAAGQQQHPLQRLARVDPVIGPVSRGGQHRDDAGRPGHGAGAARRQPPAVAVREVAAREGRLGALRPGRVGGGRDAVPPRAAGRRGPPGLLAHPGGIEPERVVGRLDHGGERAALAFFGHDPQGAPSPLTPRRAAPRSARPAAVRRRSRRDASAGGESRRRAGARTRPGPSGPRVPDPGDQVGQVRVGQDVHLRARNPGSGARPGR